MKANDPMKRLIPDAKVAGSLPAELEAIASQGFSASEGCYLMGAFSNLSRGNRASFIDATGYECFYNAVSIGSHVNDSLVYDALRFIKRVFTVWNASYPTLKLVAILSLDDFDATVRFHMERQGEYWVGDNLNEYDDPILVAYSTEGDLL